MTDAPGLQLEQAEFSETQSTEAAVCGYCGTALARTYWQVGDKPACFKCKKEAADQATTGSGLGRFVRASVYGTFAGALGAGLWYGVRAVTDLEIGLIAVVVGVMVGGAVRAGSRGRGGWLYQSLAIFLTYTAIVSTYVPIIVGQLKQEWEQEGQGQKQADAGAAQPATADPGELPSAAPALASSSPTAETPADSEPVSIGQGLVALGLMTLFIAALAYAMPFLMGFQNIIGVLIISFALWEAWKLNKKVGLEISGPYRLGAATPAETPVEPPPPPITPGLG
jgi:hypothetical protein